MMSPQKGQDRHVPSFADRAIAGLTELQDALRNKERLTTKFTVRAVELNLEPQEHTGKAIQQLRNSIKASQALFASLLCVSVSTVQSWEQGRRKPPKMARRILDEMQADPVRWIERIKSTMETRDQIGV